MIPSENFKLRNVPRTEIPARGYKFPGGTYQYGFCLNSNDQTVTIWDCSTDTVDSTVTLTASKGFSSAFYRSIDKSIYVLGNSWFDRIDFDPDSGTFGTVVESAASIVGSVAAQNYLPYPIDGFIPGRANTGLDFIFIPASLIRDYSPHVYLREREKKYPTFNSNAPRIGHQNILSARYHPSYNMIEVENTFFDILTNTNKYRSDNKFKLIANDIANTASGGYGANILGQASVFHYLFRNFLLLPTSTSCYVVGRRSTSMYSQTLTHGCGSSGRFIWEYDPASRRVMMQGKLATQGSVFELGHGTVTDLGDLSRSAYKGTNEDGTDDMAYNPVYKKVYVQGRQHGSSGGGGVDKVHIYDLSQSLGSMYQSSMTVGDNSGTARASAYAVNMIGFNGNRYWETDHGI